MKYCGHMMRGKEKYEILRLVLEGRFEGKRPRGRRRGWLDDIKEWTEMGTEEIQNRSKQKMMMFDGRQPPKRRRHYLID